MKITTGFPIVAAVIAVITAVAFFILVGTLVGSLETCNPGIITTKDGDTTRSHIGCVKP